MRVFLTGGAGLIGAAIAERLVAGGYDLHVTDLMPQTDVPHSSYAVCDITDMASVREQMRGCDAVVHMAALRNPLYGPGEEVYRVNTIGTFNVFEAAAQYGIKRVVQASSINALGCAWNIIDFQPQYLPVDEDHPLYTTDPYSFSKEQVEQIGAYYWRRAGISSVALRFPGIYRAAVHSNPEWHERRANMIDFLNRFSALPQEEQQRQLTLARHHCLTMRAARGLEWPETKWKIPENTGLEDWMLFAYIFDRYNLWASLDERDAALAVELALTADYQGAHNLFINDTHNSLGYASERLAQIFFPEVSARKQALNGSETLVSIARARELIGFEPQYSWSGGKHAENR